MHQYIDVGDGHRVYYEVHGARDGRPAVVLHGGPGGGLQRSTLRFFDLKRWRVVLFDQRGCGKSTPFASTEHNTTWDLVADMELLRRAVGVERWTLFGGSWGTTLALAYASRHAKRVAAMVLRGVCLMDRWEQDWLYKEGGASRIFPAEWAKFAAGAGAGAGQRKGTRKNLTALYSRRLRDRRTRRASAKAWWGWESAISTLKPGPDNTSAKQTETLSVLENHYFLHNAWIRPGQLLAAARKMQFPVRIVQGRYDMVCPPASAYALAQALPHAHLTFTHAGHAASEPATAAALREATDKLNRQL
jgi:proline iminopeptidase